MYNRKSGFKLSIMSKYGSSDVAKYIPRIRIVLSGIKRYPE